MQFSAPTGAFGGEPWLTLIEAISWAAGDSANPSFSWSWFSHLLLWKWWGKGERTHCFQDALPSTPAGTDDGDPWFQAESLRVAGEACHFWLCHFPFCLGLLISYAGTMTTLRWPWVTCFFLPGGIWMSDSLPRGLSLPTSNEQE